MSGAAFPTTAGYGNGLINTDGAALVDTEESVPALGPSFGATPTGVLSPASVDPDPNSTAVNAQPGVPAVNAVLIELRCITNLLMLQLGQQAPDIEQMRADELWNTTIGSGTI